MTFRKFWQLLGDTAVAWIEGDHAMFGAAIAFYTLLALSPFLVLVFLLAAPLALGTSTRIELLRRLGHAAGADVAKLIDDLLGNLSVHPPSGWKIAVFVALSFYLTTRLFTQVQAALNHLWKVPLPPQPGIVAMLRLFGLHRLIATAMVLAIGLLTLSVLAVPTADAAVLHWLGLHFPGLGVLNRLAQLGITSTLLTAFITSLYKLLPNARIHWKDALVGGAATALMLASSQALTSLYFGHDQPGAPFGTAGALLVLLLWLYYSAQVFFIGAQLTWFYANRFGSGITPRLAVGGEPATSA